MKILVALTVICLCALGLESNAQSKDPGNAGDKNFPNTLQTVNPVKYYGPRKSKKKKKKAPVTYDAQDEYYDRIEKTWRERERNEKTFDVNNGEDQLKPPYFGHKKPPKIRPIGKRKYCKICGIRH